jgi:hypothetical protein
MERFLGKLWPKHNIKPNPIVEDRAGLTPAKVALPDSFGFIDGRDYKLQGGEKEDVICPGCGAPYRGPLEPSCNYCNTGRLAFYRDVTPKLTVMGHDLYLGKKLDFPQIGNSSVNIGEYSKAQRAYGNQIEIGYYSKVETAYARTRAEIHAEARIGTLVSPIIAARPSAHIGTVLTKDAYFSDYAAITHFIALPQSKITLGDNCNITELVIGPDPVSLTLGEMTSVKKMITVRNPGDIRQGRNSNVSSQTELDIDAYYKLIQDLLNLL